MGFPNFVALTLYCNQKNTSIYINVVESFAVYILQFGYFVQVHVRRHNGTLGWQKIGQQWTSVFRTVYSHSGINHTCMWILKKKTKNIIWNLYYSLKRVLKNDLNFQICLPSFHMLKIFIKEIVHNTFKHDNHGKMVIHTQRDKSPVCCSFLLTTY